MFFFFFFFFGWFVCNGLVSVLCYHPYYLDYSKFTVITTRAHARARGYVIGRVYYNILSGLFFGTNLLSPKILTLRGLF